MFEPASATRELGLFVYAHGAGGHMADGAMLNTATALRAIGLGVVRFNFPYRERAGRGPDPMPVLKSTVAAVARSARDRVRPNGAFVIGGRSMGGRAASMLAADGFAADGLLLLAYPLHPAGKPDRLRAAHLPAIPMPVLCFNGTRDSLCRQDLMETAIAPLGERWTMHWLHGADHGFRVPRSIGRTEDQVLEEIAQATRAWAAGLAPSLR